MQTTTPTTNDATVWRVAAQWVEQRATAAQRTLVGYASVFNRYSDPMTGLVGSWREMVQPGAFRDAIGRDDVRALINHDPTLILGRTTNNTLELAEDTIGLRVIITPPDTQYARDLITLIERGDVTQMSIAFVVERDRWEQRTVFGVETLVRIVEAAKLYDVSVVTFPAFSQTSVSVREVVADKTVILPEDALAAEARALRALLEGDIC